MPKKARQKRKLKAKKKTTTKEKEMGKFIEVIPFMFSAIMLILSLALLIWFITSRTNLSEILSI